MRCWTESAVLNIPFLALLITLVQKRLLNDPSFFNLWLNIFRFQQNNLLHLHRTHSDRNWINYALKRFVASVFSLHRVESDLSMLKTLNQINYVSLLFKKFHSCGWQGPQDTKLLVTIMSSVSRLIGEHTEDFYVYVFLIPIFTLGSSH